MLDLFGIGFTIGVILLVLYYVMLALIAMFLDWIMETIFVVSIDLNKRWQPLKAFNYLFDALAYIKTQETLDSVLNLKHKYSYQEIEYHHAT